jgi:ABC-type xylose transport system permease subunit
LAIEADETALAMAARAERAQRVWRWFALSVPVTLFPGILLYGTFGSFEGVRWNLLTTPFFMTVAAGILALRGLRRVWLLPWKGQGRPPAAALARIERGANKFLVAAWAFAALPACFALVLFLFEAPRAYPFVFELIAVTYFIVYFPRKTYFPALLGYPE